ncbi:MAG: FmdE family protein [Candidatus Bathyarchaeota archaeon]|nr:FmdE family protein [Candidatus Bathyarchaeota archaeon]
MTKTREWSEELYEKASEFHGHGGLFMAAGLRMGLLALKKLDSKGWFGIRCVARLHWSPSDSCVIDGLQVSTGCTMGKHNLSVEEGDGVSSKFEYKGHSVEIVLRENILRMMRGCSDHEEEPTQILELISSAPDEELFEVI